MTEMSELPRRERARRYRAQAEDARLKAAKLTGDLQASCINLAEQWEQLAREAEQDEGIDQKPTEPKETK